MFSASVVLLTNFVPPYRMTLYKTLGCRLRAFRVLVSTPMESDRPWTAQHDGLDVQTQRTMTFRKSSNHPYGFRDEVQVHVPYDTVTRLTHLRPDVTVSDELGARTAQALIYRRLRPRSRLIIWATISEHSEEGRSFTRRLLRKVLLPRADAVLVNGASGARYVRSFGVAEKRIFVVPQTTDCRGFSSLPLDRSVERRHRLLYSGRLIELKGLAQFVSVLSRWCKNHSKAGVEFWLIGDGPERPRLEKIDLPANLRLRFLGNVAYEELPAWYSQAGVLVFPTLADTWGLVVNEAMSSGLPVLGSVHSQAVEELVKDGVNGWTFRPNCCNEMYTALDCALAASHEDLQRMGSAARSAAQHLTPESAADSIMDAIRFVVDEQKDEALSLVESA